VQSPEDTVAESTDNTEATNPVDRPSPKRRQPLHARIAPSGPKRRRPVAEIIHPEQQKLAALVLLTICFARPAAAEEIRIVDLLGAGANATCGKWSADRQSGNEFSMANWALGYLSGAATFSTLNPLRDLDSDAVLYWVDNYCRSHPLDKFTIALKAFAVEHPR
jgi:hypothetical protein